MPAPSFHGYGYGSWQTPGTYGFGEQRGIASRGGAFHGGGTSVGMFGAAHSAAGAYIPNAAGTVSAHPTFRTMGQAGPGGVRELTPQRHAWLDALGNSLAKGPPQMQSRRGVFSRYQSIPTSTGGESIPATYQKPLGTGMQPTPIATRYPGAIETTATAGELGPGPQALPPGSPPKPSSPRGGRRRAGANPMSIASSSYQWPNLNDPYRT